MFGHKNQKRKPKNDIFLEDFESIYLLRREGLFFFIKFNECLSTIELQSFFSSLISWRQDPNIHIWRIMGIYLSIFPNDDTTIFSLRIYVFIYRYDDDVNEKQYNFELFHCIFYDYCWLMFLFYFFSVMLYLCLYILIFTFVWFFSSFSINSDCFCWFIHMIYHLFIFDP